MAFDNSSVRFIPFFCSYTGYYCEQVALLDTAGLCEAGYFCGSASTMSTQNICPPGRFCPIGKSLPYETVLNCLFLLLPEYDFIQVFFGLGRQIRYYFHRKNHAI